MSKMEDFDVIDNAVKLDDVLTHVNSGLDLVYHGIQQFRLGMAFFNETSIYSTKQRRKYKLKSNTLKNIDDKMTSFDRDVKRFGSDVKKFKTDVKSLMKKAREVKMMQVLNGDGVAKRKRRNNREAYATSDDDLVEFYWDAKKLKKDVKKKKKSRKMLVKEKNVVKHFKKQGQDVDNFWYYVIGLIVIMVLACGVLLRKSST